MELNLSIEIWVLMKKRKKFGVDKLQERPCLVWLEVMIMLAIGKKSMKLMKSIKSRIYCIVFEGVELLSSIIDLSIYCDYTHRQKVSVKR